MAPTLRRDGRRLTLNTKAAPKLGDDHLAQPLAPSAVPLSAACCRPVARAQGSASTSGRNLTIDRRSLSNEERSHLLLSLQRALANPEVDWLDVLNQEPDLLPILVDLVSEGSQECLERAATALACIAGVSTAHRDQILSFNIVQHIASTLDSSCQHSTKVWRSLSRLLLALFQRHNGSRDTQHSAMVPLQQVTPALPVMALLLSAVDQEVVYHAVRIIGDCLKGGCSARIQAVIDSGMCSQLVALMFPSKNKDIQRMAVRAVARLATGTDVQIDTVVSCRVLPALPQLLDASQPLDIRRDAAWIVCNLATSKANFDRLLGTDVVLQLVAMVTSGPQPWELRGYATRALKNITHGNFQQLMELQRLGGLEALGSVLQRGELYSSGRSDMLSLATRGLKRFVQVADALKTNGKSPEQVKAFRDKIATSAGVTTEVLPTLLEQPQWNRSTHYMFPSRFKAAVRTVLMPAYKGHPTSGWTRSSTTPSSSGDGPPRKRGRLQRQSSGIWSLGLDEVTTILEMAAYPLSAWCTADVPGQVSGAFSAETLLGL